MNTGTFNKPVYDHTPDTNTRKYDIDANDHTPDTNTHTIMINGHWTGNIYDK